MRKVLVAGSNFYSLRSTSSYRSWHTGMKKPTDVQLRYDTMRLARHQPVETEAATRTSQLKGPRTHIAYNLHFGLTRTIYIYIYIYMYIYMNYMSALTLRETTLLWSLWSSREDPWDEAGFRDALLATVWQVRRTTI